MFLRREEPILLAEGGIRGLCASLNRPVVGVEDLPAGPARAVIVLYWSRSEEASLAVAVRSEDSGAVVLFEFRGELDSEPAQALDAGLQFAEGMGFLFDEDVLTSDVPDAERRAAEIWCALTRDELPEPLVSLSDEALLLDEMTDGFDELDTLEEDLSEELPLLAPDPPQQVLSKFRQPPEAPAREAGSPEADRDEAPAQLGRIPIVRRRRKSDQQARPDVPPLLTRLLARF